MVSSTTVFTPPISVSVIHPTLRSNRCQVQGRGARRGPHRNAPTMVSAASVATEIIAAGALGYGTYYLFFRDQPDSESNPDEAAAEPGEKEQPTEEAPEGIIGLSGSRAKEEVRELRIPTPVEPPPITPPPFDTIGVDINDYLDSGDGGPDPEKQRRLEEELSFATGALSDLSDCDGTIVVDNAGDVVWVNGDLVGDTVTMGSLPKRIKESGETETLNVEDNMGHPFLKPEVRNVAAMPIGGTGAVLIVASRRYGFFGEVEKRVADAVCARLAHFLPAPPSVGA